MYSALLAKIVSYYANAMVDKAESYLHNRGVQDISKWSFGYADGGLSSYLQKEGFDLETLTNLCISFSDSGNDRFVDGIIIPYFENGVPISFRFRSVEKKEYRSLPSKSPLYREAFYNLDDLLKQPEILFIAEGEFDTVVISQGGFSAIGIAGSNNIPVGWEEQLAKVKNIYIAFDNDQAGNDAAYVLTNRLSRTCRRIVYPEGYDATDFILEFGQDAFRELTITSVDLEPDIYQYSLDDVLTKTPVAFESEKAILGLLIKNPSIVGKIFDRLGITSVADTRFFYNKGSSAIFRTILKLYYDCIPIDLTNVVEHCSLPKSKISEIISLDVDHRNYIYYCNNLIKAYLCRDVLERSKDILHYSSKKSGTIYGIFDKVDAWRKDIISTSPKEGKMLIKNNLVRERLSGIQKRKKLLRIQTGFRDFDKLLSAGFVVPGEISIIGGRPREGKSAFKANLIHNLCERGCCVVNVSPEQGVDLEHDRFDSIILDRKLRDFYDQELLKDDSNNFLEQIKTTIAHIANNWNYYLFPSRDISFQLLADYLERINAERHIDVVFVDLFDKLKEITQAGANTRFVIDNLINEFNILARKLDIHVCLLHQIHRLVGLGKDKDGRPKLENLKESGRFEQDSYAVYLVYRPALHIKDIYDDKLKVIIAKQKQGICGDNIEVELGWDKETLRIYNLEEEDKI